jgi:hypothetical protein
MQIEEVIVAPQPAATRLPSRLLEMKELDDRTSEELHSWSSTHREYHPDLETVHLMNAHELETIIQEHGWPGIDLVGEEAAAAAFQIAVNAISYPSFQLWCLDLIEFAVEMKQALPKHFAIMFDRIRFNQRLPQRYGTILDWDLNGNLKPWILEAPFEIDSLRASVGLEPLGIYAARMRFQADIDGELPPSDCVGYQQKIERWVRSVGWIAE